MGIGKATPPSVGTRLAGVAADAIAARRSGAIARALRVNQWVVSGGALSGDGLDERVHANLRQIARGLYDLYHLAGDSRALLDAVAITTPALEWIERSACEPIVFAAPHLSNFDLAGRALALSGLKAQVLSVPAPTDAYQVQNELRRAVGLDITPISLASLRQAAERLSRGGSVLTGIDRPLPYAKHPLRFFGRPALLPDVHIRLAERSNAPLVLIWAQARDGGYEIHSTPIPLEPGFGGDTAVSNAERVLQTTERIISSRPTEWAMPHVVWPEAAAALDSLEPEKS
jgi:KDO2-lipid IV(A) lauroyltransferase